MFGCFCMKWQESKMLCSKCRICDTYVSLTGMELSMNNWLRQWSYLIAGLFKCRNNKQTLLAGKLEIIPDNSLMNHTIWIHSGVNMRYAMKHMYIKMCIHICTYTLLIFSKMKHSLYIGKARILRQVCYTNVGYMNIHRSVVSWQINVW